MSLIAETSNPLLLQALQAKLQRRGLPAGAMGALEPLALRLGLLQHSMKPRIREPRLLLCVADHGLAVDGLPAPVGGQTDDVVQSLLGGQAAVVLLARQLGIALTVVDCGMATQPPAREGLLQRKIAHGTRNARVSQAMSIEHAHASIRAGMEIGDSLRGNLVACAGLGLGSGESAALVLSRLADLPLRELVSRGPQMNPEILGHLMSLLQGAQSRHRDVSDPVEVLAAYGGFETGVMAGVMLVAASKRQLIMVDGMSACAALLIASRIAPAVTDYCVFCRSTPHEGLDLAMRAFQASALLDLGLDSTDGTGATLAWPMVQAATALLSEGQRDDDAQAAAHAGPLPMQPETGADPYAPQRDEGEPTVPSGLH